MKQSGEIESGIKISYIPDMEFARNAANLVEAKAALFATALDDTE